MVKRYEMKFTAQNETLNVAARFLINVLKCKDVHPMCVEIDSNVIVLDCVEGAITLQGNKDGCSLMFVEFRRMAEKPVRYTMKDFVIWFNAEHKGKSL